MKSIAAAEVESVAWGGMVGEAKALHQLEQPPETGSSFTALLELPPNQAMKLLVRSSEEVEPAAANPENISPPLALVDRPSQFSAVVTPETKWMPNSQEVKKEIADPNSDPNSSSSSRHPIVEQKRKSLKKRKDTEKNGEEGNRKRKKAANKVKAEGAEQLPYVHVRARRGQATNSHSLAERARREKINAKMKLLQDMVPGCNKISGTALVLDEIINHVHSLQRQVEILSMRLAAADTRSNFNFETLNVAEDALVLGKCLQNGLNGDSNYQGMVMPSTCHEEQIQKNRLEDQQLRDLYEFHQPIWYRENNHPNFIAAENPLLTYDSSVKSALLCMEQLKM